MVCLFIHILTYPSVHLSTCPVPLSVPSSICILMHIYIIHQSIFPLTHLSTSPSIYPSTHLPIIHIPIHPFIDPVIIYLPLFIHPSTHPSACLLTQSPHTSICPLTSCAHTNSSFSPLALYICICLSIHWSVCPCTHSFLCHT